MTEPTEEKRRVERFRILGELHGEVTVFQPMAVREVSDAGLMVETSVPLHLNSLHDLKLSFRGRSVIVKGRVIHCSISELDQEVVLYRSGLEFVERSEEAAAVIDELIDELHRSRDVRTATTAANR